MAEPFDVDALASLYRRGPGGVRLCSIPLCERAYRTRGMCMRHYRNWKRTGNPLRTKPACDIAGCQCGGKVHGAEARIEQPSPPPPPATAEHKPKRRTKPKPPAPPWKPGVPDWLDLDRLAGHTPADAWSDQAACAHTKSDLFFPNRTADAAYGPALDICARCPVRLDCLAAHLDEKWGCFAATPTQRRHVRRALAARRSAA